MCGFNISFRGTSLNSVKVFPSGSSENTLWVLHPSAFLQRERECVCAGCECMRVWSTLCTCVCMCVHCKVHHQSKPCLVGPSPGCSSYMAQWLQVLYVWAQLFALFQYWLWLTTGSYLHFVVETFWDIRLGFYFACWQCKREQHYSVNICTVPLIVWDSENLIHKTQSKSTKASIAFFQRSTP